MPISHLHYCDPRCPKSLKVGEDKSTFREFVCQYSTPSESSRTTRYTRRLLITSASRILLPLFMPLSYILSHVSRYCPLLQQARSRQQVSTFACAWEEDARHQTMSARRRVPPKWRRPLEEVSGQLHTVVEVGKNGWRTSWLLKVGRRTGSRSAFELLPRSQSLSVPGYG